MGDEINILEGKMIFNFSPCIFLCWILKFYIHFVGGGYEPEAHYPQWRRIHQSIERRHAFHDSLIKMIEGILSQHIIIIVTT